MTSGSSADFTATELLSSFRSGDSTPSRVLEACLERIESVDADVNAVATLDTAHAMEKAAISDRRWQEGVPRPLEGIPFGAKDIVETAGVRTAGGSLIYGDYMPERNATVIDRLEDAGAILLAKLQTFEFAFGDNSHYGPTRNPWNLALSAGGSSSGSAAAVAAREMPLAVGTDTGGSIRVPATLCGVSGFKPTYGRVPRTGVMTQSWTLDHVGAMARSVEDIARMMAVMAGFDPSDPTCSRHTMDDLGASLAAGLDGLTIAVPVNWFFDDCAAEVVESTRDAIQVLESAGANVVDVEIPHARHADAIGYTIMFAEFASLHEITFDRLEEYGGMTRQNLANSQFVHASDYLRALRARHLLQRDFEAVFRVADAIITPGMAAPAPTLDMVFTIDGVETDWSNVVGNMTLIMNLTGVPALSIPSGLTASGLPVGIQIAARPFGESTCFRIGYVFQHLTTHHLATPWMTSSPVPDR